MDVISIANTLSQFANSPLMSDMQKAAITQQLAALQPALYNKEAESLASYCDQVIELANEERTKLGKAPLVKDSALMNLASVSANELTVLYSHTKPDGTEVSCRENIGYNAFTRQEIVDAWMNLAGHREAITLGQYTKIGVGALKANGTIYWVMETE